MDRVAVRGTRIGAIALLALALSGGICRASAAESGERSPNPPHQTAARSQRPATPPVSSEQQAHLGSMRYYGGPKSPMWRAAN
jgi:hypothetical protein